MTAAAMHISPAMSGPRSQACCAGLVIFSASCWFSHGMSVGHSRGGEDGRQGAGTRSASAPLTDVDVGTSPWAPQELQLPVQSFEFRFNTLEGELEPKI